MIKFIRLLAFKIYRKLSILILKRNIYDRKFHIYITNRCNMNCTYCVNNYIMEDFRGFEFTQKKIEDWAFFINKYKRDVVFTGGEPFLYKENSKDIIDLINLIESRINVNIYTNLGINIIKQTEKLFRKIKLLISYHPIETDLNIFFNNLDHINQNQYIKYHIHIVDADSNLSAPVLKIFKKELTARNIIATVDKDQGFEGSSRLFKKQAICSRRIVLLAPDGTRFQCVGKMMRRSDHLENIFESELGNDKNIIECAEYGYCAACDWLGETIIKVINDKENIPNVHEHLKKISKF